MVGCACSPPLIVSVSKLAISMQFVAKDRKDPLLLDYELSLERIAHIGMSCLTSLCESRHDLRVSNLQSCELLRSSITTFDLTSLHQARALDITMTASSKVLTFCLICSKPSLFGFQLSSQFITHLIRKREPDERVRSCAHFPERSKTVRVVGKLLCDTQFTTAHVGFALH